MRALSLGGAILLGATLTFIHLTLAETGHRSMAGPAIAAGEPKEPFIKEGSRIDQALDTFRDGVEQGQEKLAALGHDLKADLDRSMAGLERRYEQASADATTKWTETKVRLQALNDQVNEQLRQLAQAATDQWREAHTAAAEGLVKLSEQIKAAAPDAGPPRAARETERKP